MIIDISGHKQSITKNFFLVKTNLIIFTMLLATAGLSHVNAQSYKAKQDSVLLSQSHEGDFMVRKYLVKHNGEEGNSEFAVRYRINLATLSTNLDDNNRELAELKAFMDTLSNNPAIHVNRVEITGYASPDGVEASNQKLAYARAETLKNYLDEKYCLSRSYKIGMQGIVESWDACEQSLANSGIADRDKALAIIRSTVTKAEKQRRLKAMAGVWNFLKANTLPKLRYADVEFGYNRDKVVEVRTLINRPKPETRPVVTEKRCCCCGEIITDSEICIENLNTGLIVEMSDVDFH